MTNLQQLPLLFQEEIWKDIINYEGLYKASNLGRIKSLNRIIKKKNGFQLIEERILKPSIKKRGLPIRCFKKK